MFASRWIGRKVANYLARPSGVGLQAPPANPARMQEVLRPCDVLLVEGDTRIATAIKYLTQSTWSHAALYVGDMVPDLAGVDTKHVLIEAHIVDGVRAVPLENYAAHHTRIARPKEIGREDRDRVIQYVVERIGYRYDFKNIVDLVRYLIPTPPVPTRWRRRMLALGSGDPTRTICSTLIAQAFESVRYPVLPLVSHQLSADSECRDCYEELLHIRHHSLFTPRDFDVSPFFEIVKPTLVSGFDYHALKWSPAELPTEQIATIRME
jgi:hypothetical protein